MANRYWVGGTASWDVTAGTKWAATSGGAGGQSVPLSIDAVFFDAASGAVTVSIFTSVATCQTLTCTGFTGTLTGYAKTAGSTTLSSGGTYTGLTITQYSGTATLTTVGKTIFEYIADGNATVSLANDTTLSSQFTLTWGTLNTNNYLFNIGWFVCASTSARVINFGTTNIALTGGLSVTTLQNLSWTGTGKFTATTATSHSYTWGGGTVTGASSSNAIYLDVNAGSGSISAISGYFKTINFTGNSASVTTSNNTQVYNSVVLSTTGTYTNFAFVPAGAVTLTTNGKTIKTIYVGPGSNQPTDWNGSVTLADDLTMGNSWGNSFGNFDLGTFNANNKNVTCASGVAISGSGVRTLNMGSGTWNVDGWSISSATSNLTFNPDTSTIRMTGTGNPKSFTGGNRTYYKVTQAVGGSLQIFDSSSFNDLTTEIRPTTIYFTVGTTQTFTNFTIVGTAGNLVTLRSDIGGSIFTLSKSSGMILGQYLSIRDSTATGGGSWTAANSTDAGNNTGWIIGVITPITSVLATGYVQTPTSSFTVALSGNRATLATGTEVYQVNLPISGVNATGSVGTVEYQAALWQNIPDMQTPSWSSVSATSPVVWSSVSTAQAPNWGVIDDGA